MTLSLQYKGFNYPGFVAETYADSDSLTALAATGSNSVALEVENGIDVKNSEIVDDSNYTVSLTDLAHTIQEATALGQSVMVRPLIDFLDPSIDNGLTGDFRSYFNPSDPDAFFSSYKTILVAEAQVAQQYGAASFCIGTEIDQLTGSAYLSDWTDIISAVRAVFSGKLTYSAEWDDDLSPWQYGGTGLAAGTGNIATQISFWNQLDYVGVDEYAPISDAANPTSAQLLAGWEATPTDPTTLAATGGQSLIQYYENMATSIGKPLFFTELGYESASDAAFNPSGAANNATFDPALQASLYQAFFDAWKADGDTSLIGTNFWDWDPKVSEVGPGQGPNFSPQNEPAQAVVTAEFTSSDLCFCAGTLLTTPNGEVPVEQLSIGDRVVTARGEARPIVWIGEGRVLATRARRSAATPVIVRRGALADNTPYRDLRVTRAHSLHFDDVLIPVEFLINHRSILWDDHAQEVLLYHIELDKHDVVLANGAPAESYRDDGNRWLFRNANSAWDLPPQPACAPVVTGGPTVDAVWRRLLQRSGPRPGMPLTDDPDLHLLVDGRRIDPTDVWGGVHRFELPEHSGSVHIMSRSGVPSELGLARDPRPLGVPLRRADVRYEGASRTLGAMDDASFGNGFHAFEPEQGFRWTTGDAPLPLALLAGITGACELMLHIGPPTRYPLVETEIRQVA